MSTLRHSVALATSVAALSFAATSFAQETPTTPTTTTDPVSPTPLQQSQVQQPVVIQPQPAPAPVVVTPPPSSTTQTTAAPYAPPTPGGDRFTERTIEHRPNKALLSTGIGVFALSYGSSVIAGAVSDRDEDRRLFVPVVGPWLDLGQRDCGAATPCGGNEDLAKAMIITSGVVQGAGVLIALGSLIIPESTTVEERTTTAKLDKPKVTVAPVSFGAGAGVGAVGRF